MKKYLLMALFAMSLFIPQALAQWVVTDPGNFAGDIDHSIKEIATASKTVKITLSGFKEVEKLYNDTQKYYDALKQVNNLIGCLLYTSKQERARNSTQKSFVQRIEEKSPAVR